MGKIEMTETKSIDQMYLEDARQLFAEYKRLADKAIAQLTDPEKELFFALDNESNSIAVIMKHMAGNMRSRWTDFLTSDGEKPDRMRDQEFEIGAAENQQRILEIWESGWKIFFNALDSLKPEDLTRTVMIRHQPHTVVQAINRQLTHYSSHFGQIIFLAKHIKSSDWKSLSVPRGKSEEFNKKMLEQMGTGGKKTKDGA
jgi:hypothetical protein